MSRSPHPDLVLWSLWNVVPPAGAVWVCGCAFARWSPAITGRAPEFETTASLYARMVLALVVATVFGVGALTQLAFAFAPVRASRVPRQWIVATAIAALLSGLAPAGVLVVLPAEDPYTGLGSPLAAFIAIVFAGAGGILLFCLPGFFVLQPEVRACIGFLRRAASQQSAMTRALRHQVTVQEGGKIELRSTDLKPGQSAEVIVLVEDSPNGRSNASFFGSGRGAFASSDEADRFLHEERDRWRA